MADCLGWWSEKTKKICVTGRGDSPNALTIGATRHCKAKCLIAHVTFRLIEYPNADFRYVTGLSMSLAT